MVSVKMIALAVLLVGAGGSPPSGFEVARGDGEREHILRLLWLVMKAWLGWGIDDAPEGLEEEVVAMARRIVEDAAVDDDEEVFEEDFETPESVAVEEDEDEEAASSLQRRSVKETREERRERRRRRRQRRRARQEERENAGRNPAPQPGPDSPRRRPPPGSLPTRHVSYNPTANVCAVHRPDAMRDLKIDPHFANIRDPHKCMQRCIDEFGVGGCLYAAAGRRCIYGPIGDQAIRGDLNESGHDVNRMNCFNPEYKKWHWRKYGGTLDVCTGQKDGGKWAKIGWCLDENGAKVRSKVV